MRARLSLLFVAVALGAACSDPPKRPPVDRSGQSGVGGGGSSPGVIDGDSGTSDDGPDAGACSDLDYTGPAIDENATNGDLPAGTGGEIEDGTYTLVDARIFVDAAATPGPTGRTFTGTLRIAGPDFERLLRRETSAGAVAETLVTGTITTSGVNATLTLTCPSSSEELVTYTASGTVLVLANLGTNESLTFTKN